MRALSRLLLIAAALFGIIATASAQVTLTGQLEVVIADHFDSDPEGSGFSTISYYLHSPFNGTFQVYFDPAPVDALVSGMWIEVTGSGSSGGDPFFYATDYEVGMSSTSSSNCSATGARKTLVVLVELPDFDLHATVTLDYVKGLLLGNSHTSADHTPDWSVNDFWQQASDGKLWIDTAESVFLGPISLGSNFNGTPGNPACEDVALRDAVFAAVAPSVDLTKFSNVVIIMPNNNAPNDCGAAGHADVGCLQITNTPDGAMYTAVSWNNAAKITSRERGVELLSHEMGHNLGLLHASRRDFGPDALGPISTQGAIGEYGDLFSTMGNWNLGFYAASMAANQLGWLAPTTNFTVVETAGTYTIQNYESRPAGVKALKVRRGTGNDAWLWIESRKNVGIYSPDLNANAFTGALIHYQDERTLNFSHLLDFTPGTTSWNDPALAVGQTWQDPYTNLTITVDSASATSLTITTSYGVATCTRNAPSLSFVPTAGTTSPGTPLGTTVTITNNNSAGCPPETFTLTAQRPTGWTRTFSSGKTVTLSSGIDGVLGVTWTSPANQSSGTKLLLLRAKGGISGLQSPNDNAHKFSFTTP